MRTTRRRRTWAKRVALATVALTVLGACASDDGGSPAGQAPERPTSVERVRLAGGDFGYPTPFAYVRGPGMIQTGYIFDTLLWQDSTGKPIPWLATAWSSSPDGLEWRFTIRDNVKWHDGQPLTLDDIKFTFEYLTSGDGAAAGGVRFDFKEIVTEAPSTVIIRLNTPSAVFEQSVAMRAFIIPRHVWSTVSDPARYRDAKALIGSGPYKLQTFDEASGSYLYVANEEFHLGVPYIKRLEFVPAPDELLALQRGEIDAAELSEDPAPEEQLRAFENDPRFGKLEGAGDWNLALHINIAKGFPYDDKRFRHALAYAIDRPDMVDRLLLGRGVPASVVGLAPDHQMLAPGLPTYERNVARARTLLDEIGLRDTNGDGIRENPDGSRFVQELQASNRFDPKSSELIKEYLREVGIDVDIQVLDRSAADTNAGQGNYTLALVGYGGIAGDADSLRNRYAAPRNSTSFSRAIGYNNPTFADLAAKQLVALNEAERRNILVEMQRIVAEDLPILPLYVPQRVAFFANAVFDNWYYTPGCSPCRGTRNKHMYVTGQTTGF
ncbi:MAG: ABC transporter substrate-binding protein [Actinomycetota bacterium]|jgi:peptide/nickel transport system substrate-binding protein